MAKGTRCYGRFPGIAGTVKEKDYLGWVELEGIWPSGPGGGDFGVTRSDDPNSIVVTLREGRAVIKLMEYSAVGTYLAKVDLVTIFAVESETEQYSELQLIDAYVSYISMQRKICSASLSYSKVKSNRGFLKRSK